MAKILEKKMEIDPIFPTPVGVMNKIELSQEEMDFILSQDLKRNVANMISIDQYILEQPKLKNLRNIITDCLDKYFAYVYKPNEAVSLKLTQSWINISFPGEQHHLHFHQNSLISGCLYLDAVEADHKIIFHKMSLNPIYIHPQESNIFNSETWAYPVETGRLIFFPSSLHHSVPENESEHSRVSLAFNAFPVGTLGKINEATELKLS